MYSPGNIWFWWMIPCQISEYTLQSQCLQCRVQIRILWCELQSWRTEVKPQGKNEPLSALFPPEPSLCQPFTESYWYSPNHNCCDCTSYVNHTIKRCKHDFCFVFYIFFCFPLLFQSSNVTVYLTFYRSVMWQIHDFLFSETQYEFMIGTYFPQFDMNKYEDWNLHLISGR